MAFLAAFEIGCATVFRPNMEGTVTITSEPTGALVRVDGAICGRTPVKAALESNKNHVYQFELDGYEPTVRQTGSVLGAGWLALDVVLGLSYPFGFAINPFIDANTEHWLYLSDDQVRAILVLDDEAPVLATPPFPPRPPATPALPFRQARPPSP